MQNMDDANGSRRPADTGAHDSCLANAQHNGSQDDQPILPEAEVARLYAACWNSLDVSPLAPLLGTDVVYESQNVFSALEGKEAVLDYLQGKIAAIRNAGEACHIFAELAELPDTGTQYQARPCVLIAQGDRDRVVVLVLFTINDRGIARIDLCTVAPHPSTARRLGIYPRLE